MDTGYTFNGHTIWADEPIDLKRIEKDVEILKNHSSEIINACYEKCAQHTQVEDTIEWRSKNFFRIKYIKCAHPYYNHKNINLKVGILYLGKIFDTSFIINRYNFNLEMTELVNGFIESKYLLSVSVFVGEDQKIAVTAYIVE